jgi:PAS domain S-box-containing protein
MILGNINLGPLWFHKDAQVSDAATQIRSSFADWPERDGIERGLFELSPRGFLLTRPDGVIAAANTAMAAILGYTPAELIGRHFNEFTHPEDALIGTDAVRDVVKNKTDYLLVEKRYMGKNGIAVWVRIHGTAVRDQQGNVLLFVSAVDDLSESRQREAERRLAAEQQAATQAQIIAAQRETLRQLSTPLIPIREGVLAIPLIGAIDRADKQE